MIWGTVGISDSLEYDVELDEMKMEVWFENAEEEVKEEMVGVVQILTDMGETKDLSFHIKLVEENGKKNKNIQWGLENGEDHT